MAKGQSALLIDKDVLDRALALKINASAVAEDALQRSIVAAQPKLVEPAVREKWLKDNADAISSQNAYVEEHGLPFAEFRRY